MGIEKGHPILKPHLKGHTLLLDTDRKSYMEHLTAPLDLTLSDLERLNSR